MEGGTREGNTENKIFFLYPDILERQTREK
jgi:hypothetical protein